MQKRYLEVGQHEGNETQKSKRENKNDGLWVSVLSLRMKNQRKKLLLDEEFRSVFIAARLSRNVNVLSFPSASRPARRK